jgi:hypothetical protein
MGTRRDTERARRVNAVDEAIKRQVDELASDLRAAGVNAAARSPRVAALRRQLADWRAAEVKAIEAELDAVPVRKVTRSDALALAANGIDLALQRALVRLEEQLIEAGHDPEDLERRLRACHVEALEARRDALQRLETFVSEVDAAATR